MRGQRRWIGGWAATALLAACVLAALVAVRWASAADGPSTVRIGISWEPASLNAIVDGHDATVLSDPLTDPILQALPDGSVEPVVASRVPSVANGDVRRRGAGMEVVVRIRPEASWSDGTPTTCRDVRQLWRTHVDRDVMAQSRAGWDLVTDVGCPDPRVAVLRFRRPYAAYLSLLQQPPLPAHDLAGQDFNVAWRDRMPVTNGPYRLVRWRRGSTVLLERDPAYWNAARGAPSIERLEFRVLSDANVLDLQVSSGEVDLLERPLEVPLTQARSTFPTQRIELRPRPAFEQLGFSTAAGRPTADPLLRQALAYSIDRQELVRMLLGGAPFTVQDGIVHDRADPARLRPWSRYRPDPDLAARRFEAAGYQLVDGAWQRDGEPLELTLYMAVDAGLRSRIAQLLQQQLADAGVALRIRLEDGAVFEERTLEQGRFDLAIWPVGIQSPHDLVHDVTCAGRRNFTGHCDEELDRLLREAGQALDEDVQAARFAAAQQRLAGDVPLLPLFGQVAQVAHDTRVDGVEVNPHAGITWNVQHWRIGA